MNYTLESFIDFCDTMEITNEGLFSKIIDTAHQYEDWINRKNPNKRVVYQPKNSKHNQKEKWYECLWADEGGNTELYDYCLQDLKKGIVEDHGVLFTALKEKQVTKQQFNVMARKCLKIKKLSNIRISV